MVWTALGQPASALVRTITVLVIACPHALGLAIPLVVSIATERAARGGILITDRMALEAMRTVDTVLFDKTGTLTEGRPVVTERRSPSAVPTRTTLLGLAAAAESESEHPLAKAIVGAARERGIDVPTRHGLHRLAGGRGHGAGRRAAASRSVARRCCRTHGLEPLAEAHEWQARGADRAARAGGRTRIGGRSEPGRQGAGRVAGGRRRPARARSPGRDDHR